MAIVDRDDLVTMDYSYKGEPFVWISANPANELYSMDLSFQGLPFAVNQNRLNIDKANSASWWSKVKKIGGKLITDINKVNSTEP